MTKMNEEKVQLVLNILDNNGQMMDLDPQAKFKMATEIVAAIEKYDGYVVVSKNQEGTIVAVTRQDDDYRVLSVIAEAYKA